MVHVVTNEQSAMLCHTPTVFNHQTTIQHHPTVPNLPPFQLYPVINCNPTTQENHPFIQYHPTMNVVPLGGPTSGSVGDLDSDVFLGDLDEFLDPAEKMDIEEAPTSSEIGGHDALDLTGFQPSKTEAQIEHPKAVFIVMPNPPQSYAIMLHSKRPDQRRRKPTKM